MSEKVLMHQIPITEKGIGLTWACRIAGIGDPILRRTVSSHLSFTLPNANYNTIPVEQAMEIYTVAERLRATKEKDRPMLTQRRIPVEVVFNLPLEIQIYRIISSSDDSPSQDSLP